MKPTRGRFVLVESLTELDRRLSRGTRDLTGWRLVGLDLRRHSATLARCDTSRTTFAGCGLAPGDEAEHLRRGALVLPAVGVAPVDPRRATLYSPDELYDSPDYRHTLDGRTYAWQQEDVQPDAAIAQTLHDHAVDVALGEWAEGRELAGLMGGHAADRGSRAYDDAARLGYELGSRLTVATGGGPGAMEAANLGARFAGSGPDALAAALERVAETASFRPSIDAWVASARRALELCPEPVESLGIPTWHYGHEPPNLFATAVAKFFRNAQREAILLQLCNRGIAFLPGAGGTVQEIFQDACENYYASEDSVAPMVLIGREYWTERLPAWPLLRALAAGRPMEDRIHLVETVEEAAAIMLATPGRPQERL
ncbi:Rossmann fold nucleotide-binding protein [Zhihengliuella sp.]|uniref:LOG family protein n=1 Tax=Zhihengliuella sp. TaxID=1954483 RepID=UPI002810FFA2|nr:Rossmann fold nucleotide-binding protein [Zhihengliuella sp.]